jgi:hypothetical protein
MLATGRYLTVFPTSVLVFPTRRPALKALPVALPLATIPIGLVTLRRRSLHRTAELFMEQARGVAKKLSTPT